MHFFFLSSFCWVLTEAWQSYMAVTGRLRNRIIRKRFLCLGWGEDPGAAEQRRFRLQETLVLLRRVLETLGRVSRRAEMVKKHN